MSRIAAIQMCSSYHVDKNLSEAAKFISLAAQQGAKLIVLPEMFAIIGTDQINKNTVKEGFQQGKIQDFLASQAKLHRVWLVGGTIPIACQYENKIRAACLVFNEQGQLVARYDKMNLFDVTLSPAESYKESATTEPGDTIVVVETPMGKLGLAVCYDLRFPNLFQKLTQQGAEIIAVPSAFTVKTGQAHWELLLRSCAVLNLSYVIGACQGGAHDSGRETYGHSMIVDPWGTILSEKKENLPGVIFADIDLAYLYKIRSAIGSVKH